MVDNPIYNQGSVPVYDTIPAETLKDSEMNDTSTFSAFKTSPPTVKAANDYHNMDESPYSPSLITNSSGNNIHAPNVSFNDEDDAANDTGTVSSLECVKKTIADDNYGEETYTVMLPGGTVAYSNCKS
ncbi:MAG: hypothetical protein MJE68_23000 [Proteobacteria bacterium]|nr:hypothetical protein [Pseudomonadota bacterium]